MSPNSAWLQRKGTEPNHQEKAEVENAYVKTGMVCTCIKGN